MRGVPRRLLTLALSAAALFALAPPDEARAGVRAPAGAPAGPAASAIVPGSVDRTSVRLSATYDVRATLRYDRADITVDSRASIRNTSGGGIDRVELNVIAAKLGRMELRSVAVDGVVRTDARVEDQTLFVPLGGVLPAGETATVRVVYRGFFRSTLGGSDWLFAKANGVVDAYRWIPWVSRARPFGRDNHGDPFVTASSPRVRVSITTDRALTFATSGRRTSVSASGLTQVFEAENVRDFNFTASPYYRVLSDTAGGVRVRVFYRSAASASTLMSYAKRAITRLEALVGEYPYPTFNVAHSAGGMGMESPGLIWIPPSTESYRLPHLVTHETAHQWFYATVGNDQAYEPYADEAMVDFLTRYINGSFRASRCTTSRLDLSIYRYTTSCYY